MFKASAALPTTDLLAQRRAVRLNELRAKGGAAPYLDSGCMMSAWRWPTNRKRKNEYGQSHGL